jgi:uncharacterized protein involved in exopolysaccharide biosynthesis
VTTLLPGVSNPSLHPASAGVDAHLAFYWNVLRRSWRMIAAGTVVAPILTAVVSATMMTYRYRALADIKPAPTQTEMNPMSVIQDLSGVLGPSPSDQAKEYIAVIRSFTFARQVMRHDPVVSTLLFSAAEQAHLQKLPKAASEWLAYRKITRNLSCYYDASAGLLRLRYVADDRDTAQRILTILLDDLISDFRDRDVAGYTAQIKSLQAQADRTSDELLRSNIYQIIAKRMEQLSTAEASALMAFRVIETPYVPPEPYRPQPLLYAAVTAAVMPFALFTMVIVIERSRAFLHRLPVETASMLNGWDRSPSALKPSSPVQPAQRE